VRRWLTAFALACPAAASARAEEDDEKRVREFLEAREPGKALIACDLIATASLRAEWRFHVLYSNGDLAAALDAALEGLEHVPTHERLGRNALVCALRLRRADTAARIRARLSATPPELAEDLDLLQAIEDSSERCTSRARIVALAGLLASAVAVVVFATRAPAEG
jgi:hypothetical protein